MFIENLKNQNNNMNELKRVFKELGFQYTFEEDCSGWSKTYKGFTLFLVVAPNGIMLASITVRNLEISLPNIPDIRWVINFDLDNSNDN